MPLFALLLAASQLDGQITWNNISSIAPASSGNEHPRIVTDAQGNPLVVWHHASRAMFSSWNGTAFTTPVLLNPPAMEVAGASWMGPDIAASGDTVYAVFKQLPEGADTSHVYCVHSYDGGVTFSAPVRVDFIADSLSRFPTVTTDSLGNPVVGFMKFDSDFAQSRWVVARSDDFGNSFGPDVKASGWSDANSVVCDCCPGALAAGGDKIAMVYRDNNDNLRDCWAGISGDNGASFSNGIGIGPQNWLVNACPSSGPDAAVIGDSLYACFMSGAGGITRVYYSKTSLSSLQSPQALRLLDDSPGLSVQNYPRLSASGQALGFVWKQRVNGTDQCVLRFSNNAAGGLPANTDVVGQNNITNCDIALFHGKIWVIWEDDNAGTIQYRSGTYQEISAVQQPDNQAVVSVSPNPARGRVSIESRETMEEVDIYDLSGRLIYRAQPDSERLDFTPRSGGVYLVKIRTKHGTGMARFCVVQ